MVQILRWNHWFSHKVLPWNLKPYQIILVACVIMGNWAIDLLIQLIISVIVNLRVVWVDRDMRKWQRLQTSKNEKNGEKAKWPTTFAKSLKSHHLHIYYRSIYKLMMGGACVSVIIMRLPIHRVELKCKRNVKKEKKWKERRRIWKLLSGPFVIILPRSMNVFVHPAPSFVPL